MTKELIKKLEEVKIASHILAILEDTLRNSVLQSLADKLRQSYIEILRENAKDLAHMAIENPMYDRLLLTQERINVIANDVESVITITSPLGKKIDQKVMDNGLKIEKIVVPLGVVAVIYESRPNVTIDIFSLCFKSGNACVLKGGKEAHHSNQILYALIQEILLEHKIDLNSVYLLPPSREATRDLLNATGLVDVCIPRGGKALIDFVRDNAKVPVIETGAGVVHTYFDQSGDVEKGRAIIYNSKTRRVSVCNALDCLIIHKIRLDSLFDLVEPLIKNNVEIYADQDSHEVLLSRYPEELLKKARPEDFGIEFLSYKLSIKTVSSLEEAAFHVQKYSSGHSEAIISEDPKAVSYFLERVDAAAVYVNASTSFTDGGQFGMGSEIGVSTQKLHARGPMGLEALTSYKWLIFGDGHIRD